MSSSKLRVKDRLWIRQAFMLPVGTIEDQDMLRRTLTTAALKFTDTTIGGNFMINPPPQFTRFADIKVGGDSAIVYARSVGGFLGRDPASGDRISPLGTQADAGETGMNSSRGMGRFYSEGLDDNAQNIVMRFGVPQFNSLFSFFNNFYDPEASMLARTGRGTGVFFAAGKAAGFLLALPFQPVIMIGRVVRNLAKIPASKYYYLKPAMPLYWNAVNTIVNGIGVNMGLVPRALSAGQKEIEGAGGNAAPEDMTASDFQMYHQMLPDIISPTGAIDVYAVGTRAQRIADKFNREVRETLDKGITSRNKAEQMRQLQQTMQGVRKQLLEGHFRDPGSAGIDFYVQSYLQQSIAQPPAGTKTGADGSVIQDGQEVEAVGDRSIWSNLGDFAQGRITAAANYAPNAAQRLGSWGTRLADFYEGERRDGADFVTFRVDYSGTSGESFSNSTKESEISQKINSAASSARSTRFSFAEGNLGDGAISSLIEGGLSAVKDVVQGTLAGVQMSGLAALAGSAFVDIPKVWDSSTANLPRADYTMELRSPYGNPLSRMRNLYIPLAMLLAGVLPLSAGKRAYTSPFLCEAYCRGRVAIRLGMIDSLSITRGTGNLGWTDQGEPLGIDVSFSIIDLSSILHMPISANFKAWEGAAMAVASEVGQAVGGTPGAQTAQDLAAAAIPSTYDDDNSYTDYLAVLGSLSWSDMIYTNRRWNLAKMRTIRNFETWSSPAHMASVLNGTLVGRVINAISQDSDRP